jgi:NADPH:quinone reductase-like Zn-dependent oxidoreductase
MKKQSMKMKAVICPKYGPPEVLTIQELPKPVPKKNEVLIKIVASTVNTGDARIRGLKVKGFMKFVMRLMLGFTKPRKPVLGVVFAGIIEQIGENARQFKVGDEVYGATGLNQGCHAEFLCISENKVITHKPKNASFEEAAALPFGGQTAIYFLRKGKIAEISSPEVLIYGATGSVGTAAVQVAKNYGATVTAVCSSKGKELTKALGADKIIEYDQEDYTKVTDKFDIILDAVGKSSKKECAPLLKPSGKFFSVEGLDIASESTEYLDYLCQLFENKKYKAIIDKVYPMAEVVEAHRFVDTGRKKGNVVLRIIH